MKDRNYGIDILRCIATLMVVILHVLYFGGLLYIQNNVVNYRIAWFLEIVCYSAVNIYALISGFVGISTRFRYRRIISLWQQVVVYGVIIAVIFYFASPGSYRLTFILKYFLPVSFRYNWYFTAYFGLFILMPLLNKGITNMTEKEAKRVVFPLLAMICLTYPVLYYIRSSTFDIFVTDKGFSLLWLVILYITGGCIAKFDLFSKISTWQLCILYAMSVVGTWCTKIMGIDCFVSYISPSVVVGAICLLVIFSRVNVLNKGARKLITFFASASFAVYIIHCHSGIIDNLFTDKFAFFANYSPIVFVLLVIITALFICLFCTLIDHARAFMFGKLKINLLTDKLIDKIYSLKTLIGDIYKI